MLTCPGFTETEAETIYQTYCVQCTEGKEWQSFAIS